MPSPHPSTTSPLPDQPLRQAVLAAHRRAELAAAEHAHLRVQAVAHLLRPVFPTATVIVTNLAGWFAEELIPTLLEIWDVAGMVLWHDDGTSAPSLPTGHPDPRWRQRRQAVEEHLSVALEFAEPALAGWHDLDPHADTAHYAIALADNPIRTVAEERSGAGREVWVLRHEDKHGDDITLHSSRQAALSAVAQTVLSQWDNITDQEDVPATPDALTDQQAIDLYFRHRGELESCTLYPDTVHGDSAPLEPAPDLGPHRLRIDLATPDGARIYQLFHQLTTEVQTADGSWPGAVVDVLTDWFTSLGFTLTAPDPQP